jgi:hypothetical protein
MRRTEAEEKFIAEGCRKSAKPPSDEPDPIAQHNFADLKRREL